MKSIGIVGFAISFGVIISFLYVVGFDKLVALSHEMNYFYAGLAVMAYVLSSMLNAVRWKHFISNMKMNAKFSIIYAITWIGAAINSITPLVLSGGEPAKAYFLSKFSSSKKSETLASVVAVNVLEYGSFIVLDIIAVMILYLKLELPAIVIYPLLATAGIGSIVVASITYTSLHKNSSLKITLFFMSIIKKLKLFEKHIFAFEKNLLNNIETFNKTLKRLSFRAILSAVSITIMLRLLDVARMYLIAYAFGVRIDPLFIIIAFAFGTVAAVVPLLPGSVGAVEPAMVAGFMLGGMALEIATAVVIVDRIIVLGLNMIMGFSCMYILNNRPGIK